jgi:hypothetical protein
MSVWESLLQKHHEDVDIIFWEIFEKGRCAAVRVLRKNALELARRRGISVTEITFFEVIDTITVDCCGEQNQ